MQALGATVVAALILYVADQILCDGRYSGVVIEALKQAALSLGIHGRDSADAQNTVVSVAGRLPYFATTVTIQRLSVPDPCSFTDRTIPVTVNPISVNVAFWPLYWA
jgi:hypothetical protein